MGDIPMSDADLLRWRDEELEIEQNANGKLADDAKIERMTLDRVLGIKDTYGNQEIGSHV